MIHLKIQIKFVFLLKTIQLGQQMRLGNQRYQLYQIKFSFSPLTMYEYIFILNINKKSQPENACNTGSKYSFCYACFYQCTDNHRSQHNKI
ncbi:unnamed protein product [Paramecium sonneborni]|uniref:Uncharacterized protein n=1 Tax=Paramecium sonneborni TaxID=65129 RepID=A0A8S1QJE3_9CILI|nr:unnamed protein product [Paramecium sonneborni]